MNKPQCSIKCIFFTKGWIFYCTVAIVSILIFSIISGSFLYQQCLKEQQESLETECAQLSFNIEEFYSRVNDFLHILGKQIVNENPDDLQKIAEIIKFKSDEAFTSNVLNMLTFGWVSRDQKLLIEKQVGIMSPPIDFSIRSYVKECLSVPWTMFFSKPAIGIPEGLWEIPGGLGITNDYGKVIGVVAFGVNIAELNSRMQQLVSKKKVSFIVLDEDFNIILRSFENTLDPKSSFFMTKLKGRLSILETEGTLTEPIGLSNISYTYFRKLEGYPYFVLMGYDTHAFKERFLSIFVPYFVGIITIITIIVSFLAFVQRMYRKTITASQFAKDVYLGGLKEAKVQALNRLIEYTDIVKKYLNGEIEIGLTPERLNQLVSKINELASNLSTEITEKSSCSLLDVNQAIKECTLICIQDALAKGVRVKLNLQSTPLLPINEIRLKQIIIGLIYFSIDLTPRGGFIDITSKFLEEGEKKLLVLTFYDNGLSLSEQDICRLQKRFDFQKQMYEDFKLSFMAIRKLITDLGGECALKSIAEKGKIISVKFSYDTERSLQTGNDTNIVEFKRHEV